MSKGNNNLQKNVTIFFSYSLVFLGSSIFLRRFLNRQKRREEVQVGASVVLSCSLIGKSKKVNMALEKLCSG
jgi:hypothetical protein